MVGDDGGDDDDDVGRRRGWYVYEMIRRGQGYPYQE